MFSFKKSSFYFKIFSLNVIGLVVLAGSIVFATIFLINKYIEDLAMASQEINMRVAWSTIQQKGTDFRITEGKLFFGDYVVNDDFEVVDNIKKLVGGTATIFMGDTRISTNVLKEDNSRAIGTKLGPGPVMDAVIGKGQPYRGVANILGEPYLTAYDPIKNTAGEVIGIVYTGIKKSDFFSVINKLLLNILGITLGVTVLLSGITYLVIRSCIGTNSLILIESNWVKSGNYFNFKNPI